MHDHDVIIIGARVAGAGTALRLARAGHDVLVIDRARPGTDTVSTHALMRAGVVQLERWGLLDEIAATTPPQHRVVFHYGRERVAIDVSRPLYAPRRTTLDPLLVAAAERAGATVRFGVDARSLLVDRHGRVVGVRVRSELGREQVLTARHVVGADGRRSRVATWVGAPVTTAGDAASGVVYGYWEGVEADGYEWCFAPGVAAGLVPTEDGRTVVFVALAASRFGELRREPVEALHDLVGRWPSVAARVGAARQAGRVRGFPGSPAHVRRPWGPGWALVGDAGYFKDPITAHGITDALRDAELLADALDLVLNGRADEAVALAAYERLRDELSLPLLDVTERLASFAWTLPEARRLHHRMSEAMQPENDLLAARPCDDRAPAVLG